MVFLPLECDFLALKTVFEFKSSIIILHSGARRIKASIALFSKAKESLLNSSIQYNAVGLCPYHKS